MPHCYLLADIISIDKNDCSWMRFQLLPSLAPTFENDCSATKSDVEEQLGRIQLSTQCGRLPIIDW